MTAEETRGRQFTLAIALWLGVVSTILLLLALTFSRRPATGSVWFPMLFAVAFNGTFSWLLYKGYRWARLLTIVGLLVPSLIRMFQLASFARDFTTAAEFRVATTMALPYLVNVFLAVVLWRAPSVVAYFAHENAPSTLSLT